MFAENTDFDETAEKIQEMNDRGEDIESNGGDIVDSLINFDDTIEIPRALVSRIVNALEYQYGMTEEFVGDNFVNQHIARIIENSCTKN